jgi:hypothetical protein
MPSHGINKLFLFNYTWLYDRVNNEFFFTFACHSEGAAHRGIKTEMKIFSNMLVEIHATEESLPLI